MLAAVFKGPGQMEVEEIAVPEIKDNEILLRVKACAICGTDIRIYNGQKTRGVRTPSVLGHEIAGLVSKVGNKVNGFKEGDRLAIAPVLPCGNCQSCKNGQENACLNRKGMGYEYDGGFAEYMRIPGEYLKRGNVFIFPDSLSFEEACLVEPLSCVYNGNERTNIKANDTVVIIGAGPIGLMHLLLSKIKGATDIIVSEPLEERRKMARQLGADLVINPDQENIYEVIKEYTGDKLADAVILTIGIPSLVKPALSILKKGGILNLFAGFPKGKEALVDPNIIHYNEVWVTGATASSRIQYEKSLNLVSRGKVNLRPLISHTFPLTEIDKAFQIVSRGEGIKVIVKP